MEKKRFILVKVFLLILVATISATDHDENMKWLLAEGFPLPQESIINIQVSEVDQQDLILQATNNLLSRPEILKSADIAFTPFNPSHGRIKETSDGGFVWTVAVKAKNAASLRVHLSEFNLPQDCQLWVYNKYCQVPGPYINQGPDNNGEFWTETLFGDTLYIQLRSYKPVFDGSLSSLGFRIDKIAPMGNQIAKIEFPDGAVVKFLETFPGCISCIEYDGASDDSHLTKEDVRNLTPVEIYKKLAHSKEAPTEFYKARERQEYMKHYFPDCKKPAYLDPLIKVENITLEPEVANSAFNTQSQQGSLTSGSFSAGEVGGVDDSAYPQDKFIHDLLGLEGQIHYLKTRRYGNYTWYPAEDIFYATVLAGSFDGKVTLKVYRKTWFSWEHIDTDTVKEGRSNRKSAKVYHETNWFGVALDFDLKVVITDAENNGWHCGVGID